MPGARRFSAASRAAISGPAAKPTAPPRNAASATPISSAPTARGGGSYPSAAASSTPSKRNGATAAATASSCSPAASRCCRSTTRLLDALHDRGFAIAVETNGTIEPPPGLDWICVSPKAGTELRIRAGHELKLVYPQAGRPARSVRRPCLRALLAATDGRAGACRQHRARHRLLPAPSAMAAEPADAQDFGNPLMWELTKSFRFEAAHALTGTTFGDAAEEVHGHSYRAEVTIRGVPQADTGMIVDTGVLERSLAEVTAPARPPVPQPHQRAWHADAGEPGTLHLGQRAARRHRRACDRAARKLRRVMHLFRAAARATMIERMDTASSPLPDAPAMDARKAARAPGSSACATTSARRSRRSRTPCPRGAPLAERAAGPLRAHAVEPHRPHRRARRRRRHGDDEGPRVREGRRACLDRVRRVRAGIPQGHSRRRRTIRASGPPAFR